MSKQIIFFSTFDDIKPILTEIEKIGDIKYYRVGLFDSKEMEEYQSIFEFKNLEYTEYGDWNYGNTFILLPKDKTLNIREVPQKKGGIKYAVDQMINNESAIINIGGIFLNNEIIIAGKIGTIHKKEFSQKILKIALFEIKKRFKKRGEFYIGSDAENKRANNWRLVTNYKLSENFDL